MLLVSAIFSRPELCFDRGVVSTWPSRNRWFSHMVDGIGSDVTNPPIFASNIALATIFLLANPPCQLATPHYYPLLYSLYPTSLMTIRHTPMLNNIDLRLARSVVVSHGIPQDQNMYRWWQLFFVSYTPGMLTILVRSYFITQFLWGHLMDNTIDRFQSTSINIYIPLYPLYLQYDGLIYTHELITSYYATWFYTIIFPQDSDPKLLKLLCN